MRQQQTISGLKQLFLCLQSLILLGGVSSFLFVGVNLLSYAIQGVSKLWLILIIPATFLISIFVLTPAAGFLLKDLPPNKMPYCLFVGTWTVLSIVSIFIYCSKNTGDQISMIVTVHLPCAFYIALVVTNVISVGVGAHAAFSSQRRFVRDKETGYKT
jgi:hypothetical protein